MWALPHAELAALDYLLDGGHSAPVYARRALLLGGHTSSTILLAGRAAVQAGDVQLAAQCWRRALELSPARSPEVANAARSALSSDQILQGVVPDGRSTLWFAERLYSAPEERAVRDQFLKEAIRRLAHDRSPPRPERLWLEARAWAKLGDQDRARDRIEAALRLQPRLAWRIELIDWLLGWGKLEEAHSHALVGLHFAPNDPQIRKALQRTAEALRAGQHPPTPKLRRLGGIEGPRCSSQKLNNASEIGDSNCVNDNNLMS